MKLIKVETSQGCLGKNIGCEEAPERIINELRENIWSTENNKQIEFGIGKVDVVKSNIDETNKNIEKTNGDVFIGGDHSITYSLFKGFAKNFKNPGLIIFDAHPDCYLEKFLNHENWVAYLIKDGIVKGKNIILIGIRNSDVKELKFIKENNIKSFDMKKVFENKEDICDTIMELAREFDGLYLSLDIDVLDPSSAPGTGYLEPGGMSVRELIYFLQRLRLLKNLKRVDLVEVNPKKDKDNLTIKTAAKLLAELM